MFIYYIDSIMYCLWYWYYFICGLQSQFLCIFYM